MLAVTSVSTFLKYINLNNHIAACKNKMLKNERSDCEIKAYDNPTDVQLIKGDFDNCELPRELIILVALSRWATYF